MTKEEKDKEIARLFRNGYKIKEIAEKLGVKEEHIKYRLQVMRKSEDVKRWWSV